MDGKVNRKSLMGDYIINDEYSLNPIGRTGLRGRGLLGKNIRQNEIFKTIKN